MARAFSENGFTGQIFPDDHRPPHVHVFNASGEARIDLDTLTVMSRKGMSNRELKEALKLVAKHLKACQQKWSDFHG